MKNRLKLLVWLFALSGPLAAQSISSMVRMEIAAYGILPVSQRRSVLRRHLQWKANAESSPLGMETNVGDFYRGLQLKEHESHSSRYGL